MTRVPGRPRVVFDCNTLIQAIAFDGGPSAACFRLAESGVFELFVSKSTVAELRRVLGCEEVLSISPNMTSTRISAFMERLLFRTTLVRRVNRTLQLPRDPDDEPYINLAVAAHADFLVTRDNDLLSLMSDHSATAKRFRAMTRPLKVINPVAFLEIFRKAN